jgi:predicted DNA-binding protein
LQNETEERPLARKKSPRKAPPPRPTKYGSALTISLEPAQKERLDKAAEKHDRSSSWVVRQAVDRHLDYLDECEKASAILAPA